MERSRRSDHLPEAELSTRFLIGQARLLWRAVT